MNSKNRIKYFLNNRQKLWNNNERLQVAISSILKVILFRYGSNKSLNLGLESLNSLILGILNRLYLQVSIEVGDEVCTFFKSNPMFKDNKESHKLLMNSFFSSFGFIFKGFISESLICKDSASYVLVCKKYLVLFDDFQLKWFYEYSNVDYIHIKKNIDHKKSRSALDICSKTFFSVFVILLHLRCHCYKIIKYS